MSKTLLEIAFDTYYRERSLSAVADAVAERCAEEAEFWSQNLTIASLSVQGRAAEDAIQRAKGAQATATAIRSLINGGEDA